MRLQTGLVNFNQIHLYGGWWFLSEISIRAKLFGCYLGGVRVHGIRAKNSVGPRRAVTQLCVAVTNRSFASTTRYGTAYGHS